MSESKSGSGSVADSSVRVSTATRKRLVARGAKGDSYDDIINRLLDATEGEGE